MTLIILLLILLIYAHLVEYIAHRWFMHKKSKLVFLHRTFYEHAIQHHWEGRLDKNINIPYRHGIVASLPIAIVFWVFLGFPFIGFPVFFSLTYCYIWSKLHRAIHDLEDNWVSRLPCFSIYKEHHIRHHMRPNRNFGAVFPWTDYLFRTKV